MNHWIDQILAFASSHPQFLGLIVFVSAAAEAIIVVGALAPGTAVILAASGIAGAADLSLWPLVMWAAGGAAVGDGVSYWIGHHYGHALSQRWPFASRPQMFEKGESFFKRHGGKSIFLGRFVPGVKAVIPAMAGMAGMNVPRFLIANLSSGILWAIAHVLPAAAAGVLLATVGAVSSRLLAALAAGVIAVFLAYWLARFLLVSAAPQVVAAYQVAIDRLSHSRSSTIRRIARAGDPRNPKLLGAIAWSALLVLASVGFAGVVQDVVSGDPLTRADVSISQLLQTVRSEPLDRILISITAFGDGVVMAVAAAALLLALAIARRWRSVLLVASAFAIAGLTVPLIKLILHRHRPFDIYSGTALFAFPSGHSTFTTLLLATLALFISPHLGLRGQIAVWTAALLGVMAVGFSRIYLGAHWPSDVMGGVFYGLLISSLLALLLRHKTRIGRAGLWSGIFASVVFLGFGTIHAEINATRDIARYTPSTAPVVISEANWLESSWAGLPQRRIDLIGETEEPLSLQFAAPASRMADVLRGAGWQTAQIGGWADFLRLLSPVTGLDSLPPWPLLHNGRSPVLMLTKTTSAGDQRLVFRLWPSNYAVENGTGREPILTGSLTQETVRHPYAALTTMRDETVPLPATVAIAELLGGSPGFTVRARLWPSGAKVFLVTTDTATERRPEQNR